MIIIIIMTITITATKKKTKSGNEIRKKRKLGRLSHLLTC